jgi:adenosylhomocysteine nucleosidase
MGATGRPRIALLAPMGSELRPLLKRLPLQRTEAGRPPVYEGAHGDVEIVATTTSMGTVAAAAAAERVLDTRTIDRVVVVGIAGGVDPGFSIGDVFVPTVVIDGATGTEYTPHPFGDLEPRGKLSTSDEFIVDDTRLARMAADGIVAVDMETSAVAAVCERRGTPWSVFRAISDRAHEGDVEMLNMAHPDGSPNARAALRYIVRHPGKLPFLLRLAQGATKAADAAADACVRACSQPGA